MNISKKKAAEARKIKAEHGYKEIYVNDKGEFFSIENYALLSVNGDKKRYMKVEEEKGGDKGESSTIKNSANFSDEDDKKVEEMNKNKSEE
ncbi:MAG: hypothetical protein LBI60_02975 [Bacteroidales bacterium]|jgi:hypothetical protein|nr:hypothetical protein [Bacteroidales bacterium]